MIPAVLIIIGWRSFWCRDTDAAGTKATGATLLFTCISAFLSLIFGSLEVSGKPFRAGGYVATGSPRSCPITSTARARSSRS